MKIDQQIVDQARTALEQALEEVPFLRVLTDGPASTIAEAGPYEPDLIVTVELNGRSRWTLLVEVKSNGEPRYAREAAQLLHYAADTRRNVYGVFIAPYVSEQGAQICADAGAGYLDFAGNCRLAFASVFIDRQGRPNPHTTKRRLRSMFSPKTERIIRTLLDTPWRQWKDTDLSEEARVSIGLVSKVKRLLEDREWIDKRTTSWELVAPDDLLALWLEYYQPGRHRRIPCYTMLGVEEAEASISRALESTRALYAFGRFSAAARWAPHVLHNLISVYVDGPDADEALSSAGLKQVDSGSNVEVLVPYDKGVLYSWRVCRGFRVTSPIQTYLDLASGGGRGEEAASAVLEYVKRERWEERDNDHDPQL